MYASFNVRLARVPDIVWEVLIGAMSIAPLTRLVLFVSISAVVPRSYFALSLLV